VIYKKKVTEKEIIWASSFDYIDEFFTIFYRGSWLISMEDFGLIINYGLIQNLEQFFLLWDCLFIYAGIAGIIADRWMNAEKLYGIFHICGGMYFFSCHR